MRFLILAGGLGTRMRPVSFAVPKPLIAYKKQPILEHILESLHSQNIDDITLSLGYGADLIKAYCDVKKFGVKFIEETSPLGTAGPLSLFDFQDKTTIVMNGDIITNIEFELLKNVHVCGDYGLTIVCKNHEYKPNLGIVECSSDKKFHRILERPVFKHIVNCGIYAVSPRVKDLISKTPLDFPELINNVSSQYGLDSIGTFNLDNYGFEWKAIETLGETGED